MTPIRDPRNSVFNTFLQSFFEVYQKFNKQALLKAADFSVAPNMQSLVSLMEINFKSLVNDKRTMEMYSGLFHRMLKANPTTLPAAVGVVMAFLDYCHSWIIAGARDGEFSTNPLNNYRARLELETTTWFYQMLQEDEGFKTLKNMAASYPESPISFFPETEEWLSKF
jgi:deoxyadenosine/deoxycytidine kinase